MVDAGVLLTRRASSTSLPTATGEKSKKAVPVPLMALHPDWVPHRRSDGTIAPEGRLWDFVERLSQFRREGKNRRDNKTGSSSLLAAKPVEINSPVALSCSFDPRLCPLLRHRSSRSSRLRFSPRTAVLTCIVQVVEYTDFQFDKPKSSFFADDRVRSTQVRL